MDIDKCVMSYNYVSVSQTIDPTSHNTNKKKKKLVLYISGTYKDDRIDNIALALLSASVLYNRNHVSFSFLELPILPLKVNV